MKKIFSALVSIFSFALVSGCAHKHLFSEEQVRKDNPGGVIADLGSVSVAPGDRVDLVRETCRRELPVRGSSLKCTTKKIGGAVVINLVDENHAVIKTDEGTTYEKGLKIKKTQ